MPRRTTVKDLPFLEGTHQEVDSKVLPDGYLSACKNVRLRKDGRFGVRADFDAIGNDTCTSTDLVPRDLVSYGDGFCAFGGVSDVASDSAIWDIAGFVGTSPVDWKLSGADTASSPSGRVSTATNLRTIPVFAAGLSATVSVDRVDCAAAGGVVCFALQLGSSLTSEFRFIQAATGNVVLKTSLAGQKPRVVAVGTTFFFTADDTSQILLSKFNPTTDADKTDLTAAFAGTATCYDLATNRAGNGFWLAVNTATPANKLRPFNSSGVAGSDIAGPAVLYDHVAIRETLTRVHLVSVLAAGTCQLRSYSLAGALSTGPTTVVATSDRQPGITDATYLGTEAVLVVVEETATVNDISRNELNALTHAFIAGGTRDDCFLGAKPVVSGTPNYHHIYGGVRTDGAFFSTFLQPFDASTNFLVGAYTNKFAAAKPNADHTPQIAKDASTGKFYWPTLVIDDTGVSRPLLTEFDFISSARLQTAQIGGLLYIGGGAVGVYDGRTLAQAAFFERPRILSATPSNGAGSLPSSTTLLVAVVWETRDGFGNVVSSDISDVSTVVMGVADDTITVVASSPHGLREENSAVTLVAYRSIDGISQLRRAESGLPGATLTLLLPDSTVRTHGIIYTQAGRAALGAILPHEAPFPADYLWKFGDRLLAANADGAQVSKELFPSAQVEWSGATGFTIPKISERIVGVGALDQRGLLFTSERIYQFSGDGPNDAGESRFSEPLPVPGSTGLLTWQSLVETPIGLFFQGSNSQLWVLPRDGSPPVWIGQPVRDTLVSFPSVTSATLVTKEQLVSFTCNNTGGTDARIVSYDLRAKTWIVDEFASSTPITSACSYSGRLAYISSGIVYTEKTSLTPASFIEHSLTTGRVKPFGSEWGKFCTIGLVGEYRGDCNLRCKVSYDDGKSFTTMGTVFQLRASDGLVVGDTIEREWNPARRKAEHIKVLFEAITGGSATEGFVFNKWRLATQPSSGMSRSPSAQRG